ncbi:MAG: hypothetical protein H0V82_04310 [Candidatus Protochlamydia sp.]|nr:hypothetical protein [Candidatus Protochlamydia sp.]
MSAYINTFDPNNNSMNAFNPFLPGYQQPASPLPQQPVPQLFQQTLYPQQNQQLFQQTYQQPVYHQTYQQPIYQTYQQPLQQQTYQPIHQTYQQPNFPQQALPQLFQQTLYPQLQTYQQTYQQPTQTMQPAQPQVYQQPIYLHQQPVEVQQNVVIVEQEEEEERESVPTYIHHQTRDLVNIGHELTTNLFDEKSFTSQIKMKYAVPLLSLLSYVSCKVIFDRKLISYINNYGINEFLTGSMKIYNTGGLTLIKGLGAASAIASLFFMGKSFGELKKLQNEKSQLRQLNGEWAFNQSYPAYKTNYIACVDRVVEKTETALDNLINKKTQEIAFLALGLIAEGVVLAGAFTGSALMVSAGAALCTSVALATLLHLGYNFIKNQNATDAEELEHNLMDFESRGIHLN